MKITGVSVAEASAIMGDNFLSVKDVMRKFKLKSLTKENILGLEQVPFPMEQLMELKEKCILWADLGSSIADIFDLYKKLFTDPSFHYGDSQFANEHCGPCWRLTHKTPIVGSNSLLLAEQLKLLGKGQRLPKARVITAWAISYYLKTGKWPCPGVMARCSDVYKRWKYIVAGSSIDKSIGFMFYPWRNDRERLIWVVPEEKPLEC